MGEQSRAGPAQTRLTAGIRHAYRGSVDSGFEFLLLDLVPHTHRAKHDLAGQWTGRNIERRRHSRSIWFRRKRVATHAHRHRVLAQDRMRHDQFAWDDRIDDPDHACRWIASVLIDDRITLLQK